MKKPSETRGWIAFVILVQLPGHSRRSFQPCITNPFQQKKSGEGRACWATDIITCKMRRSLFNGYGSVVHNLSFLCPEHARRKLIYHPVVVAFHDHGCFLLFCLL